MAEEEALDNIFKANKYEEIKKRVDYDLTVLGIGATKHSFNNTDGVVVDYVDPANLVYSYTDDPNFQDCYYFGEVKCIKVNELKKEFPGLPNEEIEELVNKSSRWNDYNDPNHNFYNQSELAAKNTLNVLYFNWKTWEHDVYKLSLIHISEPTRPY